MSIPDSSEFLESVTIQKEQLQVLIDTLKGLEYEVVGPTVRDGVIVYDAISSVSDFPIGWTDDQSPGRYRLERRGDDSVFGFSVGPTSWKRFLHPERLRLWRAKRNGGEVSLLDDREIAPKYAFIGVRACELAAMSIQDRVFLSFTHQDGNYAMRREDAMLIAVNCGQAASTCFCASMNTGPAVSGDYDLVLNELLTPGSHRFLVRCGSDRGRQVMSALSGTKPSNDDAAGAQANTETALSQMGRTMETAGIRDLLQANPEHPRWDEVADRCLSCGNCTMVCPTCFCTTVEDSTDLGGDQAERWRTWDSCFSLEFSNLHGGSVRRSTSSRYRQWMTHKLSTWIDQFGSSGCVGCGRCISWCPVGIDITEEVAAIRADSLQVSSNGSAE